MLKLIVNCGPCESYISTCLDSIKAQTYSNWQAYVTVDPCGDKTFEVALEAKRDDERISIIQNDRRMYAMANLVGGIGRSNAALEDIIVILDGDDWFYTREALQIIIDEYRKYDCWMTYGSWISNQPDGDGMWPAYAEDIQDFRHSKWLATAVRTWKKWLWDLVDDSDLRDENGEYFRVVEDRAAMFPLLEMSGTGKAKHISEALMVYNKSNPNSTGKTMRSELTRNALYIKGLRQYTRLTQKIIKDSKEADRLSTSNSHANSDQSQLKSSACPLVAVPVSGRVAANENKLRYPRFSASLFAEPEAEG